MMIPQFKQYLTATLRLLWRQKFYAFINLLGLSLGIGCSLVIFAYVYGELTYDMHNTQNSRIFRVVNLLNNGGYLEDYARVPQLLGPLLAKDHAEVEAFVRFQNLGETLVRYEDRAFYQSGIRFADANVFDVFTHRIIAGDPRTALVEQRSIAISESFAELYFGNEAAVGKVLSTERADYKVTLVFADLPENTHLKYDALLSFSTLQPVSIAELNSPRAQGSLDSTTTLTYLLLPENYSLASFQDISDSFWERYMAERYVNANSRHEYYLEPLEDIHLYSTTMERGDEPKGNRYFVFSLIAVGVLLLLIACMNYINLSTARASKLGPAVGIHKIYGASRSNLMLWLMTEAVVLTVVALIVGMALAEILQAQSITTSLFGKKTGLSTLGFPGSIGLLMLGGLMIGVLAGLYPAVRLSRLPLLRNLRASSTITPGGSTPLARQFLVFFQFVITIAVISSALMMYAQMQYFHSHSMGFNPDNRLVLRLRSQEAQARIDEFKEELLRTPGVLGVTATRNVPALDGFSTMAFGLEDGSGTTSVHVLDFLWVDENYVDVLDMSLLEGRNFSRDMQTDLENAAIINATAAKNLGWEEPIGKSLGPYTVVGVVEDFNYQNLREQMGSMALVNSAGTRNLIVDLAADSIADGIDAINGLWNEFEPLHPFTYSFMEDDLRKLYVPEANQLRLVAIFAALCVFVSCLGLYGLYTFQIEARAREIGIRKAWGASMYDLAASLFNRTFVVIALASVVATAVSYLAYVRWVANFAYRMDFNLTLSTLASLIALLVAFITVLARSISVWKADSLKSLRYE